MSGNYQPERINISQRYLNRLRRYDEGVAWQAIQIAEERIVAAAEAEGINAPDFITAIPAGSPPIPGCERAAMDSVRPDGQEMSFDIYYRYRLPQTQPLEVERIESDIEDNFFNTSNPRESRERCKINWVQVALVEDEGSQSVDGVPYKICDANENKVLISGTLECGGVSNFHIIPNDSDSLFVIFGIDEAIGEIEEFLVKYQLKENAASSWHGFEAGLTEEEFRSIFNKRHLTIQGGQTFTTYEPLDSGYIDSARGLFLDWMDVAEAGDYAGANWLGYIRNQREAYRQYQLATGERRASAAESFEAGADDMILFGFHEEVFSRLDAWLMSRDYEEVLEERRQLMRQEEISHTGYFIAGQAAGSVPTFLIPIGRVAVGASAAARIGTAAGVQAGFGAVIGAGHDEGNLVERIDGMIIGAATGGIGGALFAGLGVVIARGLSRTRIIASVRRLLRRPRTRAPQFIPDETADRLFFERFVDEAAEAAADRAVGDAVFMRQLETGRRGITQAGTRYHSLAKAEVERLSQAGQVPQGYRFLAEHNVATGRGGSRLDVFMESPAGRLFECDWKTSVLSGLSSRVRNDEMVRHAQAVVDRYGRSLTAQQSRSWGPEVVRALRRSGLMSSLSPNQRRALAPWL